MAKRYFDYDELKGKEGYFKPPDTMGRHHCVLVSQGDEIVAVGSRAGRVTLKPGDKLGYDCGTVWMVPHPDSYQDPVRRVLARARISQRVLVYSDDPVRYTVSYEDRLRGAAADRETGERVVVLGEHNEATLSRQNFPNRGEYLGGFTEEREITGGLAVLVIAVASREATTAHRRRKVSRLIVRSRADKNEVADWLTRRWRVSNADLRRDRDVEFMAASAVIKKLLPRNAKPGQTVEIGGYIFTADFQGWNLTTPAGETMKFRSAEGWCPDFVRDKLHPHMIKLARQ